MSDSVRRICIVGMGIALFVVLSLCLQVPVFENYYLCLGYVAMAVYCYSVGTAEGTLVGVLGVILYCLVIKILPSSSTGTTAAAPLCLIKSHLAIFPLGT